MSTPPIPAIPKNADPETRRFLEAVKTLLEVRAGDRGPVTDRFVTVGDLADASLVEVRSSIARGFDRSKSIASQTDVQRSSETQPQTPTGVTAVTTNVTPTSIIVTWQYDYLYPLSYFEVYRAVATNTAGVGETPVYEASLANAVVISVETGKSYIDATVASGSAYAYWVRAIGPTGLAGPYDSLNGTIGVATVDIIGAIVTASEGVKSSHLSSALSSTITTASSDASSAVTTANSASTTANSASTAASSAVTTANSASTTANTASTNASSALSTANSTASSLTTLTSDLEASHIVKTSVEGKIAGFGLFNDGTTSDFQILSDRFSITSSQTLIENSTRTVNATTDGYFIWDAVTPKQLRAFVDSSGASDVLKIENDSDIDVQVKVGTVTFSASTSETGFNSITIAANATATVSTTATDFAGINIIYIRPDETIIDATPFIVDTGVVYLDTVMIKDASINQAKIGDISANKITTGTLNADDVTISNLTVDVASVTGNVSAINNAWTVDAQGNAGFDSIYVSDSVIVDGALQGDTLAATKIFLTQPIVRVRNGVSNPAIATDTHWALFSNDFGGAEDRKSLDAQRVTRDANNTNHSNLIVTFPDADVDGVDGTRETYQALVQSRGHTLTINTVIQAGSYQTTRNAAWYKRTWRVINEAGTTVWEFTGGVKAGDLGQNSGGYFYVVRPVDLSATYANEVSYLTGRSQYARSVVSPADNEEPDQYYYPSLGVDLSGGADGWWADSFTFTNVRLAGTGPFNVQLQLDLWYDNWSDGFNSAGLKVTGYAQLGYADRTKFDAS